MKIEELTIGAPVRFGDTEYGIINIDYLTQTVSLVDLNANIQTGIHFEKLRHIRLNHEWVKGYFDKIDKDETKHDYHNGKDTHHLIHYLKTDEWFYENNLIISVHELHALCQILKH